MEQILTIENDLNLHTEVNLEEKIKTETIYTTTIYNLENNKLYTRDFDCDGFKYTSFFLEKEIDKTSYKELLIFFIHNHIFDYTDQYILLFSSVFEEFEKETEEILIKNSYEKREETVAGTFFRRK